MSTGVVPERDVLASRLAYLTVGLPTVGTVAAVCTRYSTASGSPTCCCSSSMYLITALAVEAGLHCYFSHRSFDASEPVRLFLGVAGSMAAQGPSSSGWRTTAYITHTPTPIAIHTLLDRWAAA